MSDPINQAKSIFLAAIEDHAPAEWPAFLDQVCKDDDELRAEVEKLLQARAEIGSFHEERQLDSLATIDDPIHERPGTVIGPYKLLEEIGEGGMGLVFVAEQQEPIKRRVALKIIKPGMDTRQVIARFEAERQALALMDHPHIAKVFDGGATGSGRPYFVMELVKGTPITDYCDRHRLTNRQRLELFLGVCHAVQHAHQKGIIHRDLKPSNVLVSLHDVTAVAKVIDFGIAKATSGRLTDKTVYTAFSQMVGSPLYMSPEQAGQSDIDVDTRSDVYSLGVLLYELLTGTTPFDREQFKEASYDEMRRIVREDEPPSPSTRLSTIEQAELSTIAERRGQEPRRLSQQVRGELDWIVMKALEKDRNRRYESASAFAVDVQRYLDDEPVQACPPSELYHLRKFVRRHKAGLGKVACLLVVLMVGAWILWREESQRAAAQTSVEAALERADVLRQEERWQEASAVLAVADRQLAGHGLGELRQRLEQARRDVDMLMQLDEARLQKLSIVAQGDSPDFAGADRLYSEAFQRYGVDLATREPEEAARLLRSSVIQDQLMEGLFDWAYCREKNRNPEGVKLLRVVVRLADEDSWRQRLREAAEQADQGKLEVLAKQQDTLSKPPHSLAHLGGMLREVGSWPLAERLRRRAQAIHPADFWLNYELAYSLAVAKPPELGQAIRFYQAALAVRPQNALVYLALGEALHLQGNLAEAEVAVRKAIALQPDLGWAHNNLGVVLRDQGNHAEAEAAYRKAIALKPDYAHAYNNLGVLLCNQEKHAEAEAAVRKAIALRPDYPQAHANLGEVLREEGKLAEAEAACRKAIALKPDSGEAHNNLGNALKDQGKHEEAEAAYRKAIALKPDEAIAHDNLGQYLGMQGKLAEAEEAFRKAIALKPDYADAYSNLGAALNAQGKQAEAEAASCRAIALKPDDAIAHNNLGAALNAQGKQAEAEAAYRKTVALKPDYAKAYSNLGRLLIDRGKLKDAIPCYREAARLKPDSALYHNNLAWELATCQDCKLRDPRQAVAHAKKATELAPGSRTFWNTLGVAQYRNGDAKEAIEALMKSAQLHKEGDSFDLFFLAMAHWQLNENDKARACYDRAVAWMDKNKPQDKELKRFRVEAAALLGLAKAAEKQKPKE